MWKSGGLYITLSLPGFARVLVPLETTERKQRLVAKSFKVAVDA